MAGRLMGIDVPRMTLLSFVMAALLGGISGILVAPITSLEFDTGGFFTNFGFISVAIGGMGSFAGVILGGLAARRHRAACRGLCLLALRQRAGAWRSCSRCCCGGPTGCSARPARRQDVRDEQRIHRAIVRIEGRGGVVFGDRRRGVRSGAAAMLLPGRGIVNSLVITGILFISRAGARRAHGFRRAGQPRPGRVHGDRRLYRGDPRRPPMTCRRSSASSRASCCRSLAAVLLSLVTRAAQRSFPRARDLGLRAHGRFAHRRALADLTGGPSGLAGIPSFSIGGVQLRHAAADVLSRRRRDRRAGAACSWAACVRASAARSSRCGPTRPRRRRWASMSRATSSRRW